MLKRHEEPVMVTRSSLPPLEEYVEMLKPIWDSAWLTNMGEYHETLKEKLKTYLKTPNLELFVNGHMALELTLQAMKLLLMEGKLLCEPSSAIGIGAVLAGLIHVQPEEKVCFVISGGSVGFEQLRMLDDVALPDVIAR